MYGRFGLLPTRADNVHFLIDMTRRFLTATDGRWNHAFLQYLNKDNVRESILFIFYFVRPILQPSKVILKPGDMRHLEKMTLSH